MFQDFPPQTCEFAVNFPRGIPRAQIYGFLKAGREPTERSKPLKEALKARWTLNGCESGWF